MTTTETLTQADGAILLRLWFEDREAAMDILESCTPEESRQLLEYLAALTRRAWQAGSTADLTYSDWCKTIENEGRAQDSPPERPNRGRRNNGVHLREVFAATPHGSSDPFGYGPEDDDN